ncbi:DNA methyltransferase [Aquirufa beregesia]
MKPFVFFKNESYGKEIPIEIIQIHPSVKSIIKSKKLANIEHTMKNDGQMYPVCGNLIDGVFYITDGVARYEVAKSLGWKTLKCLDINISEDDIIKNRMISNQKAQMSYTEMANSAEHLLGIIGKSQGKKRESLGFNDFDNDENYGTVGMDRYQAVIHLLNLPIGSSSLRKLMAVKWFEEENPDKKLGLMKGLDDGDFKLDKAYRLLQDRIKKQKNFDNRKLSAKEGRNNLVEYKLFNKSSLVMDEIEDNSIALFIDSHPYMDQREYRNQGDNPHGQEKTKQEYVSNFIMFCEEKKRKLKPGGYLVTILGESYSKGLSRNIISSVVVGLEDNGWEPIDLNVWVKTNQKDTPHPYRNRNSWEGIIVVRKPGGEPFFEEQIKGELDEIDFELGKTSLGDRYVKPKTSDATCITNVFTTSVFNNNELKAIDKDFKHDAPCPTSIYTSMIKSYSKPNDWIVDGFVGSGTVSIGLTLGRNVIGYDVDPKSIEFCEKRFEKCLEERESFKEVSLMAA